MVEDDCVVCGHEIEAGGVQVTEGKAHEFCVGKMF